MSYKEFCKNVAESKDGFSLGDVWRLDEASLFAIVPILRELDKDRGYKLLSETDKVKLTDTGDIKQMWAENEGEDFILVQAGEIFKGKTQTRASQRSFIIKPKEKRSFEVVCVFASKGINTNADVKSDGDRIPINMMAGNMTDYYHQGRVDQHGAWNRVSAYSSTFTSDTPRPGTFSSRLGGEDQLMKGSGEVGASGGEEEPMRNVNINFMQTQNIRGDDLSSIMNGISDSLKDILTKVPKLENQVGVSLHDEKGVKLFDCFNLTDSWQQIREKSVKQYGENLTAKKDDSGVFTFNPENAKKAIAELLTSTFEEKIYSEDDKSKVIGISNGTYVGEIVEIDKEVVHVLIARK